MTHLLALVVITAAKSVSPDHQPKSFNLVGVIIMTSKSQSGDHFPSKKEDTAIPMAPQMQTYGINIWEVRRSGNLYMPTTNEESTSTAVWKWNSIILQLGYMIFFIVQVDY